MATFVLLDTETTGAGENDRLCQIGFFILNGKELPIVQADYCKPPLPISFGAMAVHHITNEQIADKPPYAQTQSAKMLEELNTPETFMVIHNAPFDLGMLAKEGVTWRGPLIDTLRCIRHLQPELESHSLQYLRYALGFYKTEQEEATRLNVQINAHDALGDVLVLNLLMRHLVGLVNRDIGELVRLTKKPILIPKFRFGKYKDQPVEEIVVRDPDYIGWMLDKMEMDDDLRYTLWYALASAALDKLINDERLLPRERDALLWCADRRDSVDFSQEEWELIGQALGR